MLRFLFLRCVIGLLMVLATFGMDVYVTAQDKDVLPTVVVDERVELFCVLFRLAGNPEYNQARIAAYSEAVDEQFGPFRDHEAVKLAQKLRADRGVSFDAVMSLAVHVKDIESCELRVPLQPWPETLDRRWQADEVGQFLGAAQGFVKDTSFLEFFAQQRELHELAVKRMQGLLDSEAHFEWFDQFFGTPRQGSYTVVLGLLNGGNNYGVRVPRADGSLDLYGVIGAWNVDRRGQPVFGKSVLSTIVHEFCHSYANPLVDQFSQELEPAGLKIFPFVEQAMSQQAYPHWKTMMYESLVRACTIRYLTENEGRLAAWTQTLADRQRQFLWIGELAALLGDYQQQRDEYETLSEFMPQVIEFFGRYAEEFVAEQEKLDEGRPQIVSISPKPGELAVDPALAEMRIEFDQPMTDDSWSVVGGGDHFPEIVGKPTYDQGRKVWSVAIRLKPNWDYEFGLNSDRLTGFKSAAGVPLKPVKITFRTAGN